MMSSGAQNWLRCCCGGVSSGKGAGLHQPAGDAAGAVSQDLFAHLLPPA